jgi:hypothetical protein
MVIALATLLHILILVYWLGGDLGAFYSSFYLVDPARGVAERALALKILNAVDMAPGTALILALPTGLTLASATSWLLLPPVALVAIWIFHLLWLALAWAVHLRHGAGGALVRRADTTIRWAMLALLAALGGLGAARLLALPLFIALKMLVLAACIAAGLLVRHQLVPMIPAIRMMLTSGPTPATDAVIAGVIARTRIVVLGIWGLILVAAFLGIWKPE